jgi:DNA (cytosine-5)-methyltransferase 1
MNELALFAGAGGGILGGHLLGWRTVCAVEFAAYPRRVLLARQRDGMLEPFPIWDDVRTFDGKPWQGMVDVVSGGFPCTDISSAGKGAGIEGEKSGLWKEMARIICEVQPRFTFVENSPMLLSRGFGTVLGDLAEMGFDARWGVLGAGRYGAPHDRERVWVLGRNTNLPEHEGDYTEPEIFSRAIAYAGVPSETEWWKAEPRMGRVADGVVHRVDRATAIGNGQVPRVAAAAWRILTHNED